jgi:hypothetical protein
MDSLPQRWLSLNGICTTLNLRPLQVKLLYKQKYLVRIGKRPDEYRYLDPTPEYAERLRLAAVLLSKNDEVPIDLPLAFLLTTREIAEIMGWTLKGAQNYLERKPIPNHKCKNRVRLYPISAVRDMIWRRGGRKLSKQKSPFLIPELIACAQRIIETDTALIPTDEQFKSDEELQRKMKWIMRQSSPSREIMMADLLEKMELAKRVVSLLQSQTIPQASSVHDPEHCVPHDTKEPLR